MLGSRLAGEREAATRACNAANEVAVAAFLDGRLPFLGISRSQSALDAADGSPVADVEALREADREARRLAEQALVVGEQPPSHPRPRVPRQLHEAGHFYTARAVGMRPRKFYVGFPPAIAKVNRDGIEYGVGAIRSGLRQDPGDAPAGAVRGGRALDQANPGAAADRTGGAPQAPVGGGRLRRSWGASRLWSERRPTPT